MQTDFSVLAIYKTALLYGLLNTLQLVSICIVLGCLLGFMIAIARTMGSTMIRRIAIFYVAIFRGTPVLIQLFWIFFCLPLILGIEMANFTCAVIALTLYMGAITSETFRASISLVGTEQYDAGVALGLPFRVQVLHVVLPQALLRSAPTLLSNCTSLFKESALVSAVGMSDLMFVSQSISMQTGRPVEILTVAAAIYFFVAFPVTRLVGVLEKRTLAKLSM